MARRGDQSAGAALVTFMPAHDFTGYPFGEKVDFRAGVASIPVPAEYAQLMRDKGHVTPDETSDD